MDITLLLLMNTGVLVILLILLIVLLVFVPARRPMSARGDESELDQIKHQVELEGEQEAMEELMPYKPPRLDAPRQRKRL